MMNLGDWKAGATITHRWNTEDQTGALVTLGGTPALRIRKSSGSLITAGVTLTVDVVTGQHLVTVDTSADAAYGVGAAYAIEYSDGTISGISQVGRVVAEFTIEARAAYLKAADVEADTQDIQGRLPAALVSGRISADAVAIAGSTVAAAAVGTNLDAAISSRLATGGYTAPANSAILAAVADAQDSLDAIDVPTAAENAAGLLTLANGVTTGITVQALLRLVGGILAGKMTGPVLGEAGTVTVRDLLDAKNLVVATVDETGYRLTVTLDLA